MKDLTHEQILQLFTDECIEWRDDAQRRAKTGRKQDHVSHEVERLSRDLYEKLLWRRGDHQQLRQLHRERVETQENQRIRDYEEQHQRQDYYARKYNRRDEDWENIMNRRNTEKSPQLRDSNQDFRQLQERKKLLNM